MGKRYRLAVLNSHPIQYFAPLYRRIADTPDIDITVYYCSKQGLQKGFRDPGFGREVIWNVPLLGGYRYRFLANCGRDRGARGFFSLINVSIITELWKERYDAILIHGHNFATYLLALLASKVSGTRVFMRGETHLLLHRHPLKRALRRPLMRILYWLCDACLYIGGRNRDFYRSVGVPPSKLFFVPYSVDNEYFSAHAREAQSGSDARRVKLGLPQKIPVILYASKMTSRKRPRDLVLAYAELHRRGVETALLFVGDGEERPLIEKEVAFLGLPNVVFTGFVNQDELPAYYALADVFVLPSENEPWGLIINEVMSCGVPVVASHEVGASADLILDGETGFTYETGNITQLADAISRVLISSELRSTMRRNCVQKMERWGYAECIEGLRRALEIKSPRCA